MRSLAIPPGWQVRRLKFASTINDEALPESTPPDLGISYVDIGDVTSEGQITGATVYRFEQAPSRARRKVRDGDVIVSTVRTYLRAIAPIHDPEPNLIVSTGFAVVRPTILDTSFAAYALRAPYFVDRVVAASTGVSYPAINASTLGDLPVLVPPLTTQRAIAAFLDRETAKIDALIEKKRRLLDLLDEEGAALITRAVTRGLDPDVPMKDSGVKWLGEIPAHWETAKVRHLSVIGRGASPRPIDDPIYFSEDGRYGWVRIEDVTSAEKYLEATSQYLSEAGVAKSVPLEEGSLILSIAASVGKPIILRGRYCVHDGFVYFSRLKRRAGFWYYVFRSGMPFHGLGKTGTQLNLNTSSVGDIVVPVPPSNEEARIEAYLDEALSSIAHASKGVSDALSLLQDYRTALISGAVTGQIAVPDVAA